MFCSIAARAVASPLFSLLWLPKGTVKGSVFCPKDVTGHEGKAKVGVCYKRGYEVDGLARGGQGLSTLVLVRGRRAPGSITHEQQTCGIVACLVKLEAQSTGVE